MTNSQSKGDIPVRSPIFSAPLPALCSVIEINTVITYVDAALKGVEPSLGCRLELGFNVLVTALASLSPNARIEAGAHLMARLARCVAQMPEAVHANPNAPDRIAA
jgi:hypothetical protein